MRRRRLALTIATVLAAVAAASGPALSSSNADSKTSDGFSATIRWTEGGVPRIVGSNFGDVGYGYGYAIASQAICVLADTYTTVNAKRSFYFGPNQTYAYRANSTNPTNINSDVFYQGIINEKRVEKLIALKAPLGPKDEIREGVKGYVAGYNRYLRDIGGAKGIKDPACKNAAWVHPITEIEAYRRFYQLALLASSGVAIDGIAGAKPPTPSLPVPIAKTALDDPEGAAKQLQEGFAKIEIGSNAVALGSDGTRNHSGMLLGNPHFPWIGSERFFEAQLTIPGKVNVSGGSLYGVPIILIGHTDTLAWSHTVSTSYRFTPFQITLVPGSPTTYLYQGTPTQMKATEVSVDLKGGGKETRTLYSTRYGPMLTSLLGLPLFPWTPAVAFTMGDANADNFRYVNHFFEMNESHTVEDALAVLKRNQGIPWVNTIAADSRGHALYADISVTPNVPNSLALTCNSALGVATYKLLRLPVLDGSRPGCGWADDQDAIQPGTFGPSNMPYVIRDDFVTNSNDSYWLSNPKQPLEGFARIIGDERTARTLRTRIGLIGVSERVDGTDGKPGRGFSRQELQDLVFDDRQYAGELVRDDAVALCEQLKAAGGMAPTSSGAPVSIDNACDVLKAWDLHENLDSKGALLFRRFWQRATSLKVPVANVAVPGSIAAVSPWADTFRESDPVHTPSKLNMLMPTVVTALGDAISDLRGANIKLDATVGSNQYELRNGVRIPIHGGPGTAGDFNAINVGWDPVKGYQGIPHGSSFVQVVAFSPQDNGCPDARMILTYSQSPDPTSPHYMDQTKLFSQKKWQLDRFCEAQIQADPTLKVQKLVGR